MNGFGSWEVKKRSRCDGRIDKVTTLFEDCSKDYFLGFGGSIVLASGLRVSVYVQLFRGITHQDDTSCIGGGGCSETAAHLILHCDVFGSVWHYVYRWVGISFIAPATVGDHFQHFGQLAGLSRSANSFLTVIWHACVWVIWKERNNKIFQQKSLTSDRLSERVKIMSFNWLKANMPSFAFSYNDWGQHPYYAWGVLV
ncbi:hypothetical protein MTR_1g046260 [Medicago truncatula]|uniref:Uncharacterized protein n=1 Tax=Medicago truncatula TaxID=3880 RepID=A0A072VGK2_MEDTR|nr:hypothetical protein MTR_1g046260 [Medicago truncatula]